MKHRFLVAGLLGPPAPDPLKLPSPASEERFCVSLAREQGKGQHGLRPSCVQGTISAALTY